MILLPQVDDCECKGMQNNQRKVLYICKFCINKNLVNEWAIVFNANSAIFQLHHGENKLIFYEIMMRSALY
jgi:hypothetical protein